MKFNFDPFFVEHDEPTYPVTDFKNECVLAVKKAIKKNTNNLPIIIMMSGGIDSECIAKSFLLAEIPFKVVIGRWWLRLANDTITFNQYDWEYAAKFCRDNKIEQYFCDIDLFSDARLISEYALDNKCFSPQYACHMYIMKWCKDNGYFFIAGNGEMKIVLHNNEYCLEEEQREYTLELFKQKNNIPGIFQFYRQDSNLIASFLQLPTVKRLMSEGVVNLLDYKHQCYSDAFFFEPRKKQTGFENISFWDSILRKSLKKTNGKYDNKYFIPLNSFIKY